MLYFRYQFPMDVPGKDREFSLRTSDPKVARERAAHHFIQWEGGLRKSERGRMPILSAALLQL